MISGRIVRNTVVLFVRQALILAVGLYTTGALLRALGVDDFALFGVVGNVVMLGVFLPGALDMIIQRYLSVELGRGDVASLQRAHDASLAIAAAIAVLAFLVLETAGTWFVTHRLAVDPARLAAAQVLFQLTTLSFIIGIFAGFYQAVITAHEDMHITALISVGEVLLRLAAVISLGFSDGDQIVVYGALVLAISIARLFACRVFCARRYAECHSFRIQAEAKTLRGMLGFSGWTVFGQITTITRNQAVTILINQAFSPATVAARVLAVAVSAQVLTFSTNFAAALHPPIIKAHAARDEKQLFLLIFTGSRITFYLIWIVTLPLMALAPGILASWLGDSYPGETVLFLRLGLVENAITAISFPLMTAVRATGRIRLYELSLGGLQLLVFLFAWRLVWAGYPAWSVYLVAIGINLAMFWVRLAIVGRLTGLPVSAYLRGVLAPVLVVVAVSSGLVLGIFQLIPGAETLDFHPGALASAAVICLLPGAVIYILGLAPDERRALHGMIRRWYGRMGETP